MIEHALRARGSRHGEMSMIAILDYGMGNAVSVRNMCARLGLDAVISREPGVVAAATKVILPGVGHFSRCIENIDALGLRPLLDQCAMVERKPILGICMGMQVMKEGSEEGPGRGLGWISARTRRLAVPTGPNGSQAKIPHMGWSYVDRARAHPILKELPADARFYFVHSYAVDCSDEDVLLRTSYAGQPFISAIAKNNIVGVQFHLEKSHVFGMRMLESFAAWDGAP
jgi:imidazole glycerol-phosphate synthase subunit HisH